MLNNRMEKLSINLKSLFTSLLLISQEISQKVRKVQLAIIQQFILNLALK